jgi:hypothetical protein
MKRIHGQNVGPFFYGRPAAAFPEPVLAAMYSRPRIEISDIPLLKFRRRFFHSISRLGIAILEKSTANSAHIDKSRRQA